MIPQKHKLQHRFLARQARWFQAQAATAECVDDVEIGLKVAPTTMRLLVGNAMQFSADGIYIRRAWMICRECGTKRRDGYVNDVFPYIVRTVEVALLPDGTPQSRPETSMVICGETEK